MRSSSPRLFRSSRASRSVHASTVTIAGTIGVVVAALVLASCSREEAAPPTTVDPMLTWCDIANEMTTFADEQATAPADSPDADRAALARLGELLNQGRAVAPPEIEADVDLAADRVAQVADLLGSVNYDDAALSDDLLVEYDQAGRDLAQASTVITSFNQRYCGIGSDGPSRDEAIDELVATGFTFDEASCLYDAIASDLGGVGPGVVPSTEEAAALFDSCRIDRERLDEFVSSYSG